MLKTRSSSEFLTGGDIDYDIDGDLIPYFAFALAQSKVGLGDQCRGGGEEGSQGKSQEASAEDPADQGKSQ